LILHAHDDGLGTGLIAGGRPRAWNRVGNSVDDAPAGLRTGPGVTAPIDDTGEFWSSVASLVTASHILQAEIERCSGANDSTMGGLAAWQIVRVRSYIDSNLHRTIHIRDLSAVARRSKAHFSRKFKLAVGESPHAYVVRRRLERACHLMMTSAESLSEIALSVGFSDQAHLCRLFRQAFGQSPARWRRERGIAGEVTSRTGADENIP